LGIEPDATVSPRILQKMVYAGTHATSFPQAEQDLEELAEAKISAQRIARATKGIGQERIAERGADVKRWEELPLPQQRAAPENRTPPAVACVEMDGGRVQIRDERFGKPRAKDESSAKDRSSKARFWRETKVGCLLSLTSQVVEEDPCPKIPEVFVDPGRIRQIAREIKGICVSDEEPVAKSEEASTERPGRPEVASRTVVATREKLDLFGPLLAAAAWTLGFAAAARKAFVADGQEANWSVQQQYFSHYTAILDFVHAICYVFAAAFAARSMREAWPIYCRWAQWIWSGQVEKVLEELRQRQQELGLPHENESEESPRKKVADTLRYLQNQKSRMKYDEYRRQGLPITSSHIESTIKQINRRVKGSEKFWSEGGADALLQLSADYLSDTNPLPSFWRSRQENATGQRHYQTAL
jgi:hypothetical protein